MNRSVSTQTALAIGLVTGHVSEGLAVFVPRTTYFVSHKFEDAKEIPRVRAAIADGGELVVPEPLPTRNEDLMAPTFLAQLRKTKALIYIDSLQSLISPWVVMERRYAYYLGKDIYRFSTQTGSLEPEKNPLKNVLRVVPIFAESDAEQMEPILKALRGYHWMFETIVPHAKLRRKEGVLKAIERHPVNALPLFFWGREHIQDEWVLRNLWHFELECGLNCVHYGLQMLLRDELPAMISHKVLLDLQLHGKQDTCFPQLDFVLAMLYYTRAGGGTEAAKRIMEKY